MSYFMHYFTFNWTYEPVSATDREVYIQYTHHYHKSQGNNGFCLTACIGFPTAQCNARNISWILKLLQRSIKMNPRKYKVLGSGPAKVWKKTQTVSLSWENSFAMNWMLSKHVCHCLQSSRFYNTVDLKTVVQEGRRCSKIGTLNTWLKK